MNKKFLRVQSINRVDHATLNCSSQMTMIYINRSGQRRVESAETERKLFFLYSVYREISASKDDVLFSYFMRQHIRIYTWIQGKVFIVVL